MQTIRIPPLGIITRQSTDTLAVTDEAVAGALMFIRANYQRPTQVELAPVSWRVTVEGKGVAGLKVAFEPVGSKDHVNPGPESSAITDSQGRFVLATLLGGRPGAVVGPFRVRIRTVVREPAAGNQFLDPPPVKGTQPVRHLPLRYNDKTELAFEVPTEGTNSANFELSWK
jgi:hypothetical protein